MLYVLWFAKCVTDFNHVKKQWINVACTQRKSLGISVDLKNVQDTMPGSIVCASLAQHEIGNEEWEHSLLIRVSILNIC